MIKRIVTAAAVAALATGAFAAPAAAAGQACVTSTITINGEAAPTNGTNCVDLP